jgi:hypothetical protein
MAENGLGHPARSGICQQLAGNFLNAYLPGVGPALGLLQAVPALIGAFAGAPLLARELETGTFRYAWTQGSAGPGGRSPSWSARGYGHGDGRRVQHARLLVRAGATRRR